MSEIPNPSLPLGILTPRQESVAFLIRVGLPPRVCAMLNEKQAQELERVVREHGITTDGVFEHWLQAHGSRVQSIKPDKEMPVFVLKCSKCGGPAEFTPEGPNDEYPEPLCTKCEEGDE